MIRRGVLDALKGRDRATGLHLEPPFRFTLAPSQGYIFDSEKKTLLRWLARLFYFRICGGRLTEREASWETKTILRGLYTLHCARIFLRRVS